MRRVCIAAPVAVALAACGAPSRSYEPTTIGTGPGASGGADGTTGSADPATPTTGSIDSDGDDDAEDTADGDGTIGFDLATLDLGTPPTACPCDEGVSDIVLLSADGVLWVYDPATREFDELGGFDCPVFSSTSFSLAVDHRGVALVELEATGDLFAVDLHDLTCTDPGYVPPAVEPRRFGLGFATGVGESCETLLGWSYDGTAWSEGEGVGALVRLDPPAYAPVTIAPIDFNGGELAATGDGRVFAFAGAPTAALLRVDPQDGAVLESFPLPGVTLTDAFAVAFWGGDVHLFVQGAAGHSRVLRFDLDGSDGGEALVVDVDAAPLLVVGAATSTCAPTEPAG
jgi:hypothetical protein